jgi:hypothetical protein
MNRIRTVAAAFLAVLAAGCYHVTVDTGRSPSGQTIERPWANSFVYGLVPPAVVETASQCPNGVARVESQISFLNGLVAALTLSIYTPMTITVQCAGGMAPDAAASTAKGTTRDGGEAILEAARRSARSGQPVLVDLQ